MSIKYDLEQLLEYVSEMEQISIEQVAASTPLDDDYDMGYAGGQESAYADVKERVKAVLESSAGVLDKT